DIEPIVGGEWSRIEPVAIREERVAADVRDRGLEMEAARHRNTDDFVVVRGENRGELTNSFGVRARRETHEERAVDAETVAAFDGCWRSDLRKSAEFRKRYGEGCGFRAARVGA